MGNAIRCSVAAVARIERQRVDGELRNARAQLKLKDVVIETLESDRRDFAQRALEAEQQAAENTAEPIHDP